MTMAWRGLLAAFVVLGAVVMPASPASADSGLPAITHVYWTGAPCIDVVVAARFDPTQVQSRTVCEGTWRLSESAQRVQHLARRCVRGRPSHGRCRLYRMRDLPGRRAGLV
jgi:hypothetical protein